MNAAALAIAIRRFPSILAIGRRAESFGYDWCLLPQDAEMVRAEYRRVVGDLAKVPQ